MNANIAVLIPAYKPTEKLIRLARELRASGMSNVLIIDDGSGASYAGVFEACAREGIAVRTHPANRGKGAAIKTGLSAIRALWPEALGVVTADADGQHTIGDIVKVARDLVAYPDSLILGSRDFQGDVPLKSRFGNALTRLVYRFATGRRIYDTQTGLRGIPARAIEESLCYPGDRYEWEMVQLLKTRLPIREIPIETIYEGSNKDSHFSPVRDGLRVYRVIFVWGFLKRQRNSQ